jgi:hypothetical protein
LEIDKLTAPQCLITSTRAGYCSASSLANPEGYNVAAKLLIERFRHGTTSADDLSRELERHFGKVISAVSPPSFELTRAAFKDGLSGRNFGELQNDFAFRYGRLIAWNNVSRLGFREWIAR